MNQSWKLVKKYTKRTLMNSELNYLLLFCIRYKKGVSPVDVRIDSMRELLLERTNAERAEDRV
jgi:hypothetical protein